MWRGPRFGGRCGEKEEGKERPRKNEDFSNARKPTPPLRLPFLPCPRSSNLDAYAKGASTFSVEGQHPPPSPPPPRAPPPPPLPSTAPLASRLASAVAPVASSARSFITAAAASLRDAGVTAGDGGDSYRPSLPPSLHGAPATEAEGREVLSRLARMTQYTAQDFDPVECDVDGRVAASRGARDYAADETWRYALATAIGVAMGGLAFIFDASLEALNDWKFGAVASAAARGGRRAALGALLSCVLPLAVAAALLVASTTPLAAGSGIPETKAYLNGVHVPGLLRASTLAAKFASITLGMAAGLPAGKEGPFVHAGTVVGGGIGTLGSAAVARVFNRRAAAPRAWGGRFRTDADHRDFVFIGAAAGVAVAFGAPVGGLLLAVEEGASFLGVSTLIRGFLATCTGVTTLQLLAQARSALGSGHTHTPSLRLGIQRDLGLYDDDTPGVGARFFFLAADLPFVAALGAAAGLYGAAFIRLHVALTKARAAWVPPANARRRVAEVATVAALTAANFLAAAATSPCAPVPPPDHMAWYDGRGGGGDQSLWAGGGGPAGADGHASHFPRLWCPPGHYSTRGQLFVAPLVQATRRILHLGELAPGGGAGAAGAPSASSLALWLAILPPLTLLTFGLGKWHRHFHGRLYPLPRRRWRHWPPRRPRRAGRPHDPRHRPPRLPAHLRRRGCGGHPVWRHPHDGVRRRAGGGGGGRTAGGGAHHAGRPCGPRRRRRVRPLHL